MASKQVPAEYLNAGAVYLRAVRSLGLDPMFAGWGWDTIASQWLLVLVTSIVDAGGPLALNQLLFKAYNAEATPKQISPFIIRVMSPEIVPDLSLLTRRDITIQNVHDKHGMPKKVLGPDGKPVVVSNVQQTVHGIDLEMINAYETKWRQPKFHDRLRQWHRFRNNVEKLAA